MSLADSFERSGVVFLAIRNIWQTAPFCTSGLVTRLVLELHPQSCYQSSFIMSMPRPSTYPSPWVRNLGQNPPNESRWQVPRNWAIKPNHHRIDLVAPIMFWICACAAQAHTWGDRSTEPGFLPAPMLWLRLRGGSIGAREEGRRNVSTDRRREREERWLHWSLTLPENSPLSLRSLARLGPLV